LELLEEDNNNDLGMSLIYAKYVNVCKNIMGFFGQNYFFLKAYFITFPKRYGFLLNCKSLLRKINNKQMWSILTWFWAAGEEEF